MVKKKTPESYMKRFPPQTQAVLKKVRALVKKSAPKAEEGMMYGIIGYKLNGKPLVYFGGWKSHVGFYATPAGNVAVKKEIASYKRAKGSVQFPLEKVPYALIRKMVLFRVKESNAAAKSVERDAI